MEFYEFLKMNLSEIEKLKHVKFSDEDIEQLKKDGTLIDKFYELKMKKLFIEYVKIKIQNQISAQNSFNNYNPIVEAERILQEASQH